MRLSRLLCALALALAPASPARPHDPGLSSLRLSAVGPRTVLVELAFDSRDVLDLVGADADRDGCLGAAELEASRERVLAFAADGVRLSADGAAARLVSAEVDLADGDDVRYALVFEAKAGSHLVFEHRALRLLPRGHRALAALHDGSGALLATALLSAAAPELAARLDAAAPRDRLAVALEFSVLGVEHILIGYDHVLFLLALLLAGGGLARALAIITAFTVAHSVTLALASLDLVRLPSTLVEAVIAASIVWVAAQNLMQRQPRHRWRVAFAFGLVHGFGFASVLRDLGLAEAGGIAVPLLAFNLGVEVGQVAIAAVALPVVWRLHRSAFFRRRGAAALSAAVGLVGAFWLLERTVLAAG